MLRNYRNKEKVKNVQNGIFFIFKLVYYVSS